MKLQSPKPPFIVGALTLLAALALSACSRNTSQTAENSHLIRLRAPYSLFITEPLVVQVSTGSTAYIWQYSHEMKARADVSTLNDIQARAAHYKQAQNWLKKPAPVVIIGDDNAKCGAVFEAIVHAKRAGITAFYFDTYYWKTGSTGQMTDWEGSPEDVTLSNKISGKPVTITIFKDNIVAWENESGTLEDYVKHLDEIRDSIRDGKIHFVVQTNTQADFAVLRYVLDQMRRMIFGEGLTLELRELK